MSFCLGFRDLRIRLSAFVSEHKSTLAQPVGLATPVDLRTQVAAHPQPGPEQVANRINPRVGKGSAITGHNIAGGDGLNDSVQPCRAQ